MGCCSLLQGIFLTRASNSGLLHCTQILYHLNHQGSSLKPMSLLEDANTSSSELYFRDFPGITLWVWSLVQELWCLLVKKPETIKQKQYCDKLNQDIESDLHQNDLLEKILFNLKWQHNPASMSDFTLKICIYILYMIYVCDMYVWFTHT